MARAAAESAPPKKRRGRKGPALAAACKAWWRRHRRAVAVAVALVGLGFSVRLFVLPPTDVVARADAVVVMPDAGEGGLSTALGLVNAQQAAALVVLGGAEDPAAQRLCAGEAPVSVLCPPVPADARLRAAAVGALLAEQRWAQVVLVSSRVHASRDALLVGRCTDAVVLRRLADGDGPAAAAVGAPAELARYLQALFFRQQCAPAAAQVGG
ncbi:MAG: hypothetical protein R2755_31815 [Acidimicrobiales bacterium]